VDQVVKTEQRIKLVEHAEATHPLVRTLIAQGLYMFECRFAEAVKNLCVCCKKVRVLNAVREARDVIERVITVTASLPSKCSADEDDADRIAEDIESALHAIKVIRVLIPKRLNEIEAGGGDVLLNNVRKYVAKLHLEMLPRVKVAVPVLSARLQAIQRQLRGTHFVCERLASYRVRDNV
jgi:hypothetical protein